MADDGPPPFPLFLVEGQRALLESFSLPAARPLLRRAAKGDGQPVLLLPGFAASDASTQVLRRFLKGQGFAAHPWLQGRNFGPRGDLGHRMGERVAELRARYGRRVSLVGWSLGGVYARELAKAMPDDVRQVVTLGSPFADVARPSNTSRLYDWIIRNEPSAPRAHSAEELAQPPDVPTTSIFTKTDGVVHWKTCLEPEADHTENIEVPGSHCGLGFNPLVLYVVADRLGQPEYCWQPFHYRGWRRALYR